MIENLVVLDFDVKFHFVVFVGPVVALTTEECFLSGKMVPSHVAAENVLGEIPTAANVTVK